MNFKFPCPQREIPGWSAAMFISLHIVCGYFCILIAKRVLWQSLYSPQNSKFLLYGFLQENFDDP